jgi:hypothetical protein
VKSGPVKVSDEGSRESFGVGMKMKMWMYVVKRSGSGGFERPWPRAARSAVLIDYLAILMTLPQENMWTGARWA